MSKNRNFGQKSKCWSKIEILVKNRNFGRKSNFFLQYFGQESNFGQKSTRNLDQKSFFAKISTFARCRNFGQTFWTKIETLSKMESNLPKWKTKKTTDVSDYR